MKSRFWSNYGAYFSCITTMLIIQLVVNIRIEHLWFTVSVIIVGFFVNYLLVGQMKRIKTKNLGSKEK